MPTDTTSLRLPPRRAEQLKAISVALNLPLSDTIGHLIRREIAAGTIPDHIPGVIVARVDRGISITIDEHPAAIYRVEEARELASTIREVAAGGSGVINTPGKFGVYRRGNGIKLSLPFPGPETAFPVDIVRDIAALIEKAAQ